MFDTMTMTKILGAFFGALLFFLLGSWAASGLYATASGGHGDDGHAVQGYVIAMAETDAGDGHGDTGGEEAVVELVAGDPVAGEKVFKKCKACHKLEDGAKAVGPDLFAIVGRDVAARAEFSYSTPMQEMGGVWDAATLNDFLTDPKGMVPGTKMTFKGLPKPADRADVIAYLETIGG